mmetsp:Transcript_34641/g.83661  ORF Transcript_34641/g.83661 Transcript_34641/m.83661 type:complete len:420 (-) Transcript_34641:45-1304(-)
MAEEIDLVSVQIPPNEVFKVPSSWSLVRKLGSGSYGTVVAFRETSTSKNFAVKKVAIAVDLLEAQRTLREIALLSHFHHPNVLSLIDVLPVSPDATEVYLVTELMDYDLHQLIYRAPKPLTDHQQCSLMYQLLRGLLALHSAHVVHRDIKPSNLLLTSKGILKIGDLGLARGLSGCSPLTQYVVTRYYRSPELLVGLHSYTYSVDSWSAGAVFCEMLKREPIFPGKNTMDQLKSIFRVRGTPSPESLRRWVPPQHPAMQVLLAEEKFERQNLQQLLPSANPRAVAIADALLQLDPQKRPTVAQVIQYPYFKQMFPQDVELERSRRTKPVDWTFDGMGVIPQTPEGVNEAMKAVRAAIVDKVEELRRPTQEVAPRDLNKTAPAPESERRDEGGVSADSAPANLQEAVVRVRAQVVNSAAV